MLTQIAEVEHAGDDANHYATHLAEVNNTQEVITTEDIRAQNGMTLVKKGTRVTAEVAQRILQHKLLKPIEAQVKLENTLDTQSLRQHLEQLFRKYTDLQHINQAHAFENKLADLLEKIDLNVLLYQKLTVLSERLPDVYEKALFCAWLCALIATEQPLKENEIRNVFIAGLFHDIGLLHIDPAVLNKKTELAQDEWRAIQSHVVVGYLIFKESDISNPEVARAILEHHESCDGTGYPKGRSKEQLSVLGQILALADSVQAVRINRFKDSGRTIHDALPLLHMNSGKHFLTVYKTICLIILNSELPIYCGNPYASFPVLIDTLLERVDKLQDAIVVLMLIRDLTTTENPGEHYDKYLNVIDPVIFMIRSSGMVRDELTVWLKKLRLDEDSEALCDLNEYDLMQTELLWQLKKVVRVINEYIDVANLLSSDQRQHLKKLSDYIHSTIAQNH